MTPDVEPATQTHVVEGPPPTIPPDGDAPGPERGFVLETIAEGAEELWRLSVQPLPFRIGRRAGLELVLPSNRVSKVHAEIFEQNGTLRIRDHESRNGTFVNQERVSDSAITEGDIIQVGDFEFRIGRDAGSPERDAPEAATATYTPFTLSRQFLEGARAIKELLSRGDVTVELQPLVYFGSGEVAAWEALGRGTHPALPREPVELFRIAESIEVEVELSRLLRRRAVELVAERAAVGNLFLNTHPSELAGPGLIESIEELRNLAPHLDLTLEIHESALAQPAMMAMLRDRLAEMNVRIAYDDFGSGQARLLELAEAPPHYLKFDRRFVVDIDQAPPSRRRLVASLVAAARELLVKTVAEGVETPAEAEVCERLGFTLAQGYHFGRPTAVDTV
jgi:EAL domain-containing protein (putative c-di-GMP-specific phosphodiesterase class I)